MRCHKCGFTSFDYLSECKKCGVDLTVTREKLGFSPVKPSVPFLLGSLLRTPYTEVQTETVTAVGGEPAWSNLTEIDLGDETSIELDFSGDDESTIQTSPGHAQMKSELDSARKVLEEIEKPLPTNEALDLGGDLELDLDSVLGAAPPSVEEKKPEAAHSEDIHLALDDAEIEFSDADLELFMEDTESPTKAASQAQQSSTHTPAGRLDTDRTIRADEPLDAFHEGMVLEFSPGDLDNILDEWEEMPGGKQNKKSGDK